MTRISIVVALLFGVVFAQFLYDSKKQPEGFAPIVVFPVPVLRSADLGLHSAFGSLIWLNAVQEVGTVDGSYEGLVEDIKAINALDPLFAYPYAFAELVLPALDRSKVYDAVSIGKQGVASVSDWRIPFYLASTYMIYLDDRESALEYFQIAARTPGIPTPIQGTALNFGTQKDKRAQTKEIWNALYQSTDDEILRDRAQANLVHIDILEALEKAIAVYKQRKGVFPASVDDLVTAGILKAIPQDPLGFMFTIDEKGAIASHL
ncbi:hypothetical protein HZC00_02710 [Candidatus Kaiserbacteria bacterium]|nr:hypothetical protein [Candidatus Kaiserbacteria bacterium]